MEKLNLDQFISIQQQKVINHKFSLENAFQEILYWIDNWIDEGSGRIVELIESHYIACRIKNFKKAIINNKNNNNNQ